MFSPLSHQQPVSLLRPGHSNFEIEICPDFPPSHLQNSKLQGNFEIIRWSSPPLPCFRPSHLRISLHLIISLHLPTSSFYFSSNFPLFLHTFLQNSSSYIFQSQEYSEEEAGFGFRYSILGKLMREKTEAGETTLYIMAERNYEDVFVGFCDFETAKIRSGKAMDAIVVVAKEGHVEEKLAVVKDALWV